MNDKGELWCQWLDDAGACEAMRHQYRHYAIQDELCETFLSKLADENISYFIFGSQSEGTRVLGMESDIDLVICDESLPVITNIDDIVVGGSFLMVQTTRPGYVKLQLVNGGKPLNETNFHRHTYKLDGHGRRCLDHDTAFMYYCEHKSDRIIGRSGPAFTTGEPKLGTDVVPAFRCSAIPEHANEWLTKRSNMYWPSSQLLDEMEKLGCLVVMKGHPKSAERNIEWKVSFSLQERLIMFSLTPVQHKCYIYLKLIKQEQIEPRIPNTISSYHMKTSVFFLKEITADQFWSEHNLIICVRLCLLILLTWINQRFIPNFFIPKDNLFGRHMADMTDKEFARLRKCIHTLIYNNPLHVKLVTNFFIQKETMFDKHHPLLVKQKECYIHFNQEDMKHQQFRNMVDREKRRRELIQHLERKSTSTEDFYQNLDAASKCLSTMSSPVHKTDEIETAKDICSLLLNSMLMQSCASTALMPISRQQIGYVEERLNKCSFYWHYNGRYSDVMTTDLVLATVLYRKRDYYHEDVLKLLDSVEASDTEDVISLCKCTRILKDIGDVHVKQIYSHGKIQHIAPCVIFTKFDFPILLEPLHVEMVRLVGSPISSISPYFHLYDFWFVWAVVDARIYQHFLRYRLCRSRNDVVNKRKAFKKLKQSAQKAEKFVDSADQRRETNFTYCLGHIETAWNLIGWIYVQEGMMDPSVRCFTRSWQRRRTHNAAKWHLAMLLFDLQW